MSSVWRGRKRTEVIHVATRLALAGMITAVTTVAVSCALTDARMPEDHQPAIDPEVRVVTQRGSARVLVELAVAEDHGRFSIFPDGALRATPYYELNRDLMADKSVHSEIIRTLEERYVRVIVLLDKFGRAQTGPRFRTASRC